jgi:hypothetical protein
MGLHTNTGELSEKGKLSEQEISLLKELVRELLEINETQNAQLIAFNAKLQNEEAKVRVQQRYISQLELALTTTQNQA